MKRLFEMSILFIPVLVAAHLATDALHLSGDAWFFFAGILVSGITGFVYERITGWWRAVTAPERKQSITQYTDKTPKEVVDAANRALIKGLGIIALTVVVGAFQVPTLKDAFLNWALNQDYKAMAEQGLSLLVQLVQQLSTMVGEYLNQLH